MIRVKELFNTLFGNKKPITPILDYEYWNGCCPHCDQDHIDDIGNESIAGIGGGIKYECLCCHDFFIVTDYNTW